jgi:hypothetical protein
VVDTEELQILHLIATLQNAGSDGMPRVLTHHLREGIFVFHIARPGQRGSRSQLWKSGFDAKASHKAF